MQVNREAFKIRDFFGDLKCVRLSWGRSKKERDSRMAAFIWNRPGSGTDGCRASEGGQPKYKLPRPKLISILGTRNIKGA